VTYQTYQYLYLIVDTNKEVAYIERRKELWKNSSSFL
jgi:hypothetical protein